MPDAVVTGVALMKPIEPVQKLGQPNEKPVPNAVISVRPAGGTCAPDGRSRR